MFKRLFWLTMGAGFGFGVSFWLMRWVRETTEKVAERYAPERLAREVRGAARRVITTRNRADVAS
jgi:hypothetical protein